MANGDGGQEARRRDLMILLLAVAGGGVDAVVILGFGVLTAAQTGNTIILATALAQGRFATGLSSAVSIVGYVVGAAVGELVIVGRRGSASRPAAIAWALVAELVLLGALLVAWRLAGSDTVPGVVALLVALAATAMGIQSAAVLRIDAGPTTTYVTGTLTTFMTETVRWLRLVRTTPARHDPGPRSDPRRYGVAWVVYAVGAAVSALLYLRAREAALVLPMAAIVAAVVAGARRR